MLKGIKFYHLFQEPEAIELKSIGLLFSLLVEVIESSLNFLDTGWPQRGRLRSV